MTPRRFTAAQVNELIPTLEVVMRKLLHHAHLVHRAAMDIAGRLGLNPHAVDAALLLREKPEVGASLQAIEEAFRQVANLGGEVKGLDLGLVDFPAELDGQEVLLCWQFGEREVGYYHLPDEGFAGRKPLPEAGAGVRVLH
ncbi:MAG: DUF2203 domain-containing protein [Candidatus Binatia bacterium]|nr:DUF2203 domain-containing protein [Candidatus Binatia bacterium]